MMIGVRYIHVHAGYVFHRVCVHDDKGMVHMLIGYVFHRIYVHDDRGMHEV